MLVNNAPVNTAGQIYDHIGRTFFVAPSASYTIGGKACVASDGNDGLSPDRAFLTVAAALSATAASVGDVVVLLPGAHTAAASLAMSKAGITLMGLSRGARQPLGQHTTLTTTADDEVINVTAADCKILDLGIIGVTTKAAVNFSSAAHRLQVAGCYFDMATAAVNTGTVGLDATGAASGVLIEDNYFLSDGAQGVAIDVTAITASIVRRNYIVNNAGTWAAAVSAGAATANVLFEANIFLCTGTAMTVGVDGTGATIASGVIFMNNRFSSLVTKGVDNFDAGEAELSENYDAGVGGTDGGVLVVAIT
jgi:hypothetical protein